MSSLFHTLVVCGAGLTLLDCGGKYSYLVEEGDEPSAGRSPGGSGASVGGHGGASSDGSAVGGLLFGGGPPDGPQPGYPPLAGAGNADEQLECERVRTCGGPSGEGESESIFTLTGACVSAPARPKSVADCGANESLACLVGRLGNRRVLFNCECTPGNDSCACPDLTLGCTSPQLDGCSDRQVRCGCAWTCIVK